MISIGAALAVDSAANFFYQMALILMKIAHHNTEKFKGKSSFTQPIWLCGLLLLIFCTVVRVRKQKHTFTLIRSATICGSSFVHCHFVPLSCLRRVSCHRDSWRAVSAKVRLNSDVLYPFWLCADRDAVQLYPNDIFGKDGD